MCTAIVKHVVLIQWHAMDCYCCCLQQAKNIMLHDRASITDPITGLQQKTHYGRPQWNKIFEELAQDHVG